MTGQKNRAMRITPDNTFKRLIVVGARGLIKPLAHSFLQKGTFELIYGGENYFTVPQSSILMLEREEEL